MKIAISSDLYWPTVNGVSTASHELALGLAERGHKVLVLAPSQTGVHYIEKDGKTNIVRLKSVVFPFYHNQIDDIREPRELAGVNMPNVPIYPKNGFRICLTPRREIRQALNDFEPDVIHNHNPIMIGQEALRYANRTGIPFVETNHVLPENLVDNLKMFAPLSRPISRAIRWFSRVVDKADYVTMPTQVAIDMFFTKEDLKYLPMPVEAVSNGIDLSRYSPGKVPASVYKKFGLSADQPIVTYLGRVDAEKHISVLVEAFARIQRGTGAHLLIVGAGTDEANLQELAEELGVAKHVTLTGRVSDKDKLELLRIGQVYCMPSPVELQSIATLEAMASGQPVVAVDAGAVKELCQDGRNGFLCEKDNVDQVAVGLEKILIDGKLRDKFAAESLKIAKTHDIDYTLKRFEEIYKKAIKNYKPRY
ncbi:MAG: glycosyltransferase [Candidatus Nomurabacteria bacterium]|jgi:glycosyltransferase involved in cell wall biosynthesis|nr:glycosyltransferase [Candidatus Nomurabacteria bacterium]